MTNNSNDNSNSNSNSNNGGTQLLSYNPTRHTASTWPDWRIGHQGLRRLGFGSVRFESVVGCRLSVSVVGSGGRLPTWFGCSGCRLTG